MIDGTPAPANEASAPGRFAHLLPIAVDAFQGSSMNPGRRGRLAIAENEAMVTEDLETIDRWAATSTRSSAVELANSAKASYAQGYERHFRGWLGAVSRTISSFVTGASNFPTKRNQKRLDTETRRYDEWQSWRSKTLASIKKQLANDPNGPTELDKLKANLAKREHQQELFKAVNAIIRSKKDVDSRLIALGLSAKTAIEVQKPDFAGRVGIPAYELTNNNAEIRRLKTRIEEMTQRELAAKTIVVDERTFEGGTASLNYRDNRLQLFFDRKPEPATIAQLKTSGFKWSPYVGAWQRQLTDNALRDASAIVGPMTGDDTGQPTPTPIPLPQTKRNTKKIARYRTANGGLMMAKVSARVSRTGAAKKATDTYDWKRHKQLKRRYSEYVILLKKGNQWLTYNDDIKTVVKVVGTTWYRDDAGLLLTGFAQSDLQEALRKLKREGFAVALVDDLPAVANGQGALAATGNSMAMRARALKLKLNLLKL